MRNIDTAPSIELNDNSQMHLKDKDQRMESNTTSTLPATSLTICSRNRPSFLLDCVQSVLAGDQVPSEIIIVDQSDVPHQTLTTPKTDLNCQIRYLWTKTRGVGYARNEAIRAAHHDIIILIDDDELVTVNWLDRLVRALTNAGQRSVVTGSVAPAPAEAPNGFAPSLKVERVPAVYEGRAGDILFTGNMAMYRSAMDEIGTFDERFGTGARFASAYDNDFCFRLLEAGYRIIYVPEATIFHRAWRSGSDHLRLSWNYGRGQGAFYAKHFRWNDRYMLGRLKRDIGCDLVNLAQRRRNPRLAMNDVIHILGLFSGAAEWLLTQRRTAKRCLIV